MSRPATQMSGKMSCSLVFFSCAQRLWARWADELGWPLGPEGNEEGGMPAAGAAGETTPEVLTG